MAMALEGLKVLDVSQVAAIPMAARHLADFGADVIHIEHPVRGDSWRKYQAGQQQGSGGGERIHAPSPINYNWENFNRNKRSLTLDLAKEGGREILYRMVATSDVFLTNLRPFELEKFRVQYDTLNKLNQRLIYGHLTGYGKEGPDKDHPGYDATAYWARTGIPYRYQSPGCPPAQISPAFGDNVAGMAMAFGVMIAIRVREKTGIGQEVDLSLFHIGLYQLSFDIAGALVTGQDYADWKVSSREDVPNSLANIYETGDGRWLQLTVLQPDRYWARFCAAIGKPELEHDPRFETFDAKAKNHVVLFHILQEVFHTRTLEEWKPRLKNIPWAPFQNYREVTRDPQAEANGMFPTFDHPTYGPIRVVANPVKLSRTPATLRTPAPEAGQHTEEVLLEHGYSWEEIASFKEQGIIG